MDLALLPVTSPVGSAGINYDALPHMQTPVYNNLLSIDQISPEYFNLATNMRTGAPAFHFQLELLSPYSVSFRNRLQENKIAFQSASRQLGNNHAAQDALAVGKYQADTGVLGEEFRTNQAIRTQVTTQNKELLN